jgi:hypothetical protein
MIPIVALIFIVIGMGATPIYIALLCLMGMASIAALCWLVYMITGKILKFKRRNKMFSFFADTPEPMYNDKITLKEAVKALMNHLKIDVEEVPRTVKIVEKEKSHIERE